MSGIDLLTAGEVIDDRPSAGYLLRCARERLGFSIREVASALHLLVSHVRAIEANRYDALADDQHFLRHLHDYANLVDLDASEILDIYRTQSAEVSAQVQPQLAGHKTRPHGAWFGVGVLVMTGVYLAISWLNQTLPPESSNDAAGVPLAVDSRKDTITVGKIDRTTRHETGKRFGQAALKPIREPPTQGVVSSAITYTDPNNTHLGVNRDKNALLAAGTAPLKNALLDLKHDDSAQAPSPVSMSPMQTVVATQLRSAEWFASLAPDRYTLQLLSFTREESSRAFIQRHQLQDQAAYFAVRNDDDQTWYAVTYGLYDSYEEAEAAGQTLPDSIKDLKPRVRNTGRIQQLITAWRGSAGAVELLGETDGQ